MLQACHEEPFARNAIVAISALSASKSLAIKSSLEIVTQHKEFALQQYEKAIRTMRVSLSQSVETNPRKALIACLLVCCFESLSGHYVNTLGHAKSGYQLLRDWLARYPPSVRRFDGIASPAPDVIEDDLVQAFTRLDHQVVSFFDSRPTEVHVELKDFGTSTIGQMPEVFSSLNEAQQYLVLIQVRKGHFLYATSKIHVLDTSLDVDQPPSLEPSRLFLEKGIHDEFMTKLTARVAKMRQGNGMEETTQIGPQISKEHQEKIMGYIKIASGEGASLACGGDAPGGDLAKGYFVKPTIFTGVNNDMRIAQEEVFGPVTCIYPFNDMDEAIAQANSLPNNVLSLLKG